MPATNTTLVTAIGNRTSLSMVPPTSGCPPHLSQRADVQVVAKEVLRVVLRLELPEPRVIRTVHLQGRISGFVVIQIVQVASTAQQRTHGIVGFAGTPNAALGVLRISPLGDDGHVETFVPE